MGDFLINRDIVTAISIGLYRLADYALLNSLDDPAILAMAFC